MTALEVSPSHSLALIRAFLTASRSYSYSLALNRSTSLKSIRLHATQSRKVDGLFVAITQTLKSTRHTLMQCGRCWRNAGTVSQRRGRPSRSFLMSWTGLLRYKLIELSKHCVFSTFCFLHYCIIVLCHLPCTVPVNNILHMIIHHQKPSKIVHSRL
jgi:hypothetical protein